MRLDYATPSPAKVGSQLFTGARTRNPSANTPTGPNSVSGLSDDAETLRVIGRTLAIRFRKRADFGKANAIITIINVPLYSHMPGRGFRRNLGAGSAALRFFSGNPRRGLALLKGILPRRRRSRHGCDALSCGPPTRTGRTTFHRLRPPGRLRTLFPVRLRYRRRTAAVGCAPTGEPTASRQPARVPLRAFCVHADHRPTPAAMSTPRKGGSDPTPRIERLAIH